MEKLAIKQAEDADSIRSMLEHNLAQERSRNKNTLNELMLAQSKRGGHYRKLEYEQKQRKALEKDVARLRRELDTERKAIQAIKSGTTYQVGYHVRNARTPDGLLRLPLAL